MVAGSPFLTGLLPAQSTVSVANFSSRGVVGTGEDVKILGAIIAGDPEDYKPVLFRGVGP